MAFLTLKSYVVRYVPKDMLKQWSELAAIEFALDIYRCDRYSGLIQALSWSKTQNPDFCIFGVLYSYLLSDLLFAS